ncbi:Separin [Fasciola hepatica]|uniref:separase n=1 Tax=Fasciola hepatica TaxID=6192 RepID=A0A4E0R6A8_FASHE|nr:Separin [Fasciola hepatica]
MGLPLDLSPFFTEFSRLSSLIQRVVPSINENNVCESSVALETISNDEVYSGIPTVISSGKISEAVESILSGRSEFERTPTETKSIRPLLTRIELFCLLSDVYNLFDAESRCWDIMFALSQKSGRYLDASYALVSRLLSELLYEEQNTSDAECLKSKANDLKVRLESHRSLFDATDEAILTGQLPTPHAHLQAVLTSLAKAYVDNYMNWCKFIATLELIPIRFSDFFAGKSWAAVCARGYYYWLHLHARCVFGIEESDADVQFNDSFDNGASVAKPPSSVLHAAVIVRMHGRTLVQFMRQCCEQKLAKRSTQLVSSNKENKCTANPADLETKKNRSSETSKTVPWGSGLLTDNELLNLWLGTRLLIRGCQQVAELYTLMGNVREARAYQDELLRVAQRFHICRIAQTALSLMAHVELFAQRKWAFELRLRQLNYLFTCQIPLEEIASGQDHRHSRFSVEKQRGDDDADEAAFLLTDQTVPSFNPLTANSQNPQDNLATADALSAGSNPLMAANVHAFASIFPCSPTRTDLLSDLCQGCFPTPSQLASLISGRPYKLCSSIMQSTSGDSVIDELYDRLDRNACAVGCQRISRCVERVLNGAFWPWLDEITRLVRAQLLPAVHYLPAVVKKAPVISRDNTTKQDEPDDTRALLEAFGNLTTSPDIRDRTGPIALRVLREVQSPPNARPSTTAKNHETIASDVVDVGMHTGQTMPPPLPPLNAPPRRTDRWRPVDSSIPSKCTRSTRISRKNRTISDQSSNRADPTVRCIQTNTKSVLCTPIASKRAQSTNDRLPQPEALRQLALSDVDRDSESEMILRQLGYELAPRRRPSRRAQVLQFYVDQDENAENNRRMATLDRTRSAGAENVDPVESCPTLAGVPPRPRNLRLASRWEADQRRGTHPVCDLSPPSSPSYTDPNDPNGLLTMLLDQAQSNSDLQATRVEAAYRRLAAIPVPNLLRPVCHWLGLYWLGKDSQTQAGRYLAQSVGIAATSLYVSILSSRIAEMKPSQSAMTPPSPEQLSNWSNALKRTKQCVAPCHPLRNPRSNTSSAITDSTESAGLRVIQLCLVDEIAAGTVSPHSFHLDCPSGHQPLPMGLGARNAAYLVATRYTGLSSTDPHALQAETRVLHGFTNTGLKALDSFDELQVESLDSMQIEDRVRYWRTRYKLDSRLEAMLSEMHRDWFTPDDLKWLLGPLPPTVDPICAKSSVATSVVLILDRRLSYLPWEWILSPEDEESNSARPTFTRSFSLPLVLGHLSSTSRTGPRIAQVANNLEISRSASPTFNPRETFYVLNPEANLSFTQQTFEPIFQGFPTWHGVIRRLPTTEEVNTGFTDHDLFIYLGHGNGSRFLLQTFNQGMCARAVTLVLGCSSGKPRWEGRHEPYSSLFNHLIAGCPLVAGLLWDVTDRDVDRFTLRFLTRWLCDESDVTDTALERPSLGSCVSSATTACKLKHLVGKSVIVYGLPIEPNPNYVLPTPSRR